MSFDTAFYLLDHRLIGLAMVVLLLIMDINRPQRGRFEIGTEILERVGESMVAAPDNEKKEQGQL